MITGTYALVAWGIVAALLLGFGMAFDVTALIILGLIGLTGGMAVGVARKIRSGAVGPRTCPHCSGLVAPSAPYCKHCGESLEL